MVNRVLIRMKVVQLLYSYLLTKSDFKIRNAPAASAARDTRFAHEVYIDTLLTLLELSGYNTDPADPTRTFAERNKVFNQSPMMRALAANDDLRSVISRRTSSISAVRPALSALYAAITASDAYGRYNRARSRSLKDDVQFWTVMLRSVIKPSKAFEDALRSLPDFTIRGYEAGIDMVAETLSEYNDERNTLTAARNALTRSLDQAYELYHGLLALPGVITRAYEERLEANRNKFMPTAEDLNPNTRLLENRLVKMLAHAPAVQDFANDHPGQWEADFLLITHFLDAILASDIYARYKELPAPSLHDDAEFWRSVMKHIILPDNELAETLENKSIYWNDDLDIMSTFALKTMKRIGDSDGEDSAQALILPQYKDDEDACFGPDLFLDVVNHYDEYRSLIDSFVEGRDWDAERLAFMDVVIMLTAIAEVINYPKIPIPVSLNEYIEIAKAYSTPKSGRFINGVLYSVINKLKEEGRIRR